ncbi:MAG: SRPBCC family protein [Ferruginibacter sp.]
MRLIKGFILAILGLFVVVTIFSLIMPSNVLTVRTVVINAPLQPVFTFISDIKHWEKWHPVLMHNRNSLRISDFSVGIKAEAEWRDGQKVNKIKIMEVAQDHVKLSVERTGENKADNIISVSSMPGNNSVQVEWRVITTLKWYPWEKFSGMFIDKITGAGYEAALNNLKDLAEGNATPGN